MNSTTSNHFPTANFSLRRDTSATSLSLAYAYYRLSQEEAQDGQSSASIINQRKIVEAYCAQRGIVLLDSFVDDGWSGSNFERPGFQQMMKALQAGKANMVITKDLSRLGRDMREASYYAEQFFPERRIHYVAIADNFDSESENIMAPFQFAMNEVYLRDGSRKVKDVLRMKRSKGEYCACPPFGYKKDRRRRLLHQNCPGAHGSRCDYASEVPGTVPRQLFRHRCRPRHGLLELHHGKTNYKESGLSWQYAAWENPQGKHQVPQKDFRSPGGLGHNVQHARTSR